MDFNPNRSARIDRSKKMEKKNRKFDSKNIIEYFDDEEDILEDKEDRFEKR